MDPELINPFEDPESIIFDDVSTKTLMYPTTHIVPILPSIHRSRASSLDSTTSKSTESAAISLTYPISAPICWTDADLNYLISCVYPALTMANQLVFVPPLEDLHDTLRPIHLQLFALLPVEPIPAEMYSQYAPIGTGRPVSRVLVAESYYECDSPTSARASLAKALLSDRAIISAITAKYTVLAALYVYPEPSLCSILRGMKGMLKACELERAVRLYQLQQVVNDRDDFELRLETFLLEAGNAEAESWVRCVEVGLELGREDREGWADVYAEAGGFLRKACEM